MLFTWVCEPKMKFETDLDEFLGDKLIMGQLCNSFKHLPKEIWATGEALILYPIPYTIWPRVTICGMVADLGV